LGFQVGQLGQWGFSAKAGGKWISVVNGAMLGIGGIPSRCEIRFSEDGRRYGYVVHPVAGDPASKRGVVLDGVHHPELELASDLVFVESGLAIATVEEHGLPGGATEQVLHVVGQPTPEVPPTRDDYEPSPMPNTSSRTWVRVQIGESLGPRMDRVDMKSISLDPDGRIRYRGHRTSGPVDLVDNVVQKRAPARATVAE
jgi:hypothetical protein